MLVTVTSCVVCTRAKLLRNSSQISKHEYLSSVSSYVRRFTDLLDRPSVVVLDTEKLHRDLDQFTVNKTQDLVDRMNALYIMTTILTKVQPAMRVRR